MSKQSEQSQRLTQLEEIEKNISKALEFAGQVMTEMAKDKPVLRNVEANSNSFAKTLEGVETGLLVQINYLTTVSTSQPHVGSSYAAQKELQMAYHRFEHIKSRLSELESIRAEHIHQQQQQQQQLQ